MSSLPTSRPRPGAQSIGRAMGLVNLVARHHDLGISLQALVQASGLDRTTAWRMLGSLLLAGWNGITRVSNDQVTTAR